MIATNLIPALTFAAAAFGVLCSVSAVYVTGRIIAAICGIVRPSGETFHWRYDR